MNLRLTWLLLLHLIYQKSKRNIWGSSVTDKMIICLVCYYREYNTYLTKSALSQPCQLGFSLKYQQELLGKWRYVQMILLTLVVKVSVSYFTSFLQINLVLVILFSNCYIPVFNLYVFWYVCISTCIYFLSWLNYLSTNAVFIVPLLLHANNGTHYLCKLD